MDGFTPGLIYMYVPNFFVYFLPGHKEWRGNGSDVVVRGVGMVDLMFT